MWSEYFLKSVIDDRNILSSSPDVTDKTAGLDFDMYTADPLQSFHYPPITLHDLGPEQVKCQLSFFFLDIDASLYERQI